FIVVSLERPPLITGKVQQGLHFQVDRTDIRLEGLRIAEGTVGLQYDGTSIAENHLQRMVAVVYALRIFGNGCIRDRALCTRVVFLGVQVGEIAQSPANQKQRRN